MKQEARLVRKEKGIDCWVLWMVCSMPCGGELAGWLDNLWVSIKSTNLWIPKWAESCHWQIRNWGTEFYDEHCCSRWRTSVAQVVESIWHTPTGLRPVMCHSGQSSERTEVMRKGGRPEAAAAYSASVQCNILHLCTASLTAICMRCILDLYIVTFISHPVYFFLFSFVVQDIYCYFFWLVHQS